MRKVLSNSPPLLFAYRERNAHRTMCNQISNSKALFPAACRCHKGQLGRLYGRAPSRSDHNCRSSHPPTPFLPLHAATSFLQTLVSPSPAASRHNTNHRCLHTGRIRIANVLAGDIHLNYLRHRILDFFECGEHRAVVLTFSLLTVR